MGYEHVWWGEIPPTPKHTQAEGEEGFTHTHKTIPICLRRQTPLLGFLGSRSCMNMWKRNVSLLSTGHICNSIYCSQVQEIHQTDPISNHREIQSVWDRGKPTPHSLLCFILIGLDCKRRRRSPASCRGQEEERSPCLSPGALRKASVPRAPLPMQTRTPTPAAHGRLGWEQVRFGSRNDANRRYLIRACHGFFH